MTRAQTKAPASQAKGARSTARTSQTTSAKKSKASASRKPAQKAEVPVEVLESAQISAAELAPTYSSQLAEPSAIQKGRQPKHINSTQALAMGTAAAGISHLLGWM